MNITPKILSIPPYVSTSWKNIASMHVEHRNSDRILIVSLHNGTRIEIPQLETSTIEIIFNTHSRFLEHEENASNPPTSPTSPLNLLPATGQILSFEIPFRNGLAEMEGLGSLLEHNPSQANSPDLPKEVLEKITQLSQTMSINDPHAVPKPEPHCNCMRCQIARAMQAGVNPTGVREEPEEMVSDEDLKFRSWDVVQKSEQLYQVINPLDEKESYNVFLGCPIGCTCGEKQCEHIKAVLNT